MKLNVAPNACRPIPRKSPPQTAYKRSKICKSINARGKCSKIYLGV